jgi:hypothetical protein
MTEPTLTELRGLAEHLKGEAPPGCAWRALIDAFLSLTDPAPLTADQCREAGCRGCGGENKRWDFGRNYVWMSDSPDMHIENPTLGQLRLALLQEDRDGE